jgi:hypothetical protein
LDTIRPDNRRQGGLPLSVSEQRELAGQVALKYGVGWSWDKGGWSVEARGGWVKVTLRPQLGTVAIFLLDPRKARRLVGEARWLDSLTW